MSLGAGGGFGYREAGTYALVDMRPEEVCATGLLRVEAARLNLVHNIPRSAAPFPHSPRLPKLLLPTIAIRLRRAHQEDPPCVFRPVAPSLR